MKTATSISIVCLAFMLIAAQKPVHPLQAMVDTERAFARMSVQQGIRPSFMAFIADDGILFRPRAVKGKQWMTEHPLPPSDKRPVLSWRPSFADISRSGDIGYTFGPWEYKNDVKEAAPSAYGHFVTVWKKQVDGTWKFAVDLGVSHPQTSFAELPMHDPFLAGDGGFGPKPDQNRYRATFIKLEKAFLQSSVTRGARQAFLSYAAPGVRVFREGKTPLEGKGPAALAIPESKGVWSWTPEAWDVSRAHDLAYSYGTYELRDNGKVTETGNYLRIWKEEVFNITTGRSWKVVVDVANPIPPK